LLAALDELASTTVAVMILFPVVNVPIFLVLRGLASRAYVSDDHGLLLTSTGLIRVFGQQYHRNWWASITWPSLPATEGIIGREFAYGAVVFIELQAGVRLALWPRSSIVHDAGLALGAASPTEFTLGHNVSSKVEVDAVMQQASNAGAIIVKPAQETFWGGYAGYFQDPDGHLWEVAWNPQWVVDA
jgi:uncharacterized protein